MRPQHLTQVAHEGNPVECEIEVLVASGGLESPNPFTGGEPGHVDPGGPVLYPRTGSGGPGGDDASGGDTPTQPIVVSASGSMDCAGSQSVTMTATGGIAPYTWATTTGQITNDGSKIATLTPPANPGASVEPNVIAFGRVNKFLFSCAGPCQCKGNYFNCAGTELTACTNSTTDLCISKCGSGWHCTGFRGSTIPAPTARTVDCPGPADLPLISGCDIDGHTICSCDLRDAFQIANACLPCDISFHSAVVSVTDAQGHTAYATVLRNVNVG